VAQGRLWTASAITYTGAMAADAASSWNHYELNPVLQDRTGRFNGRGLAIKTGITGAVLLGEWLILRRRPSLARAVTIINFGVAAPVMAVAIHNFAIQR
jgi:hypothetical protein